MRASIRFGLALLGIGMVCAPVYANPVTTQLSEALYQTLETHPESLQWMMPNETEVLSTEDLGITAKSCTKPVPARFGPSPRFLLRCVAPQLVGFRMAAVQTVTSWEYTDEHWSPGQIISVHDVTSRALNQKPKKQHLYDPLRYTRNTPAFKTLWHKGELTGTYEKMFTYLSEAGAEDLVEFWNSVELPASLSLEDLNQWRALPWPPGIVAIQRNGRVLSQKGSVAGAGMLIAKITEPDALPNFVQGLVRPNSKQNSWGTYNPPGTPMYALKFIRAKDTTYAIALSDQAPETDQHPLQLLSSDPDVAFVIFAVKRNI